MTLMKKNGGTITRRKLLVTGGVATGLALGGVAIPGAVQAAEYATGDMVLGDPDAPVEVIEYASMTCPHCRRFHEAVYPPLKKDWIDTGKVRFIFREFPLDRYALQASMLARCGGEQKFFGFIDLLFQQQSNWTSASDPAAALRQIGVLGGISGEAFEACMADETLVDMILATRLDGHQRMKVAGTPSVYVNGEKVGDPMDYEDISDRIRSAL